MDVLEYYDPPITWDHFDRGPLSADVWTEFCDVVRLCHSYKYWTQAAASQRHTRPPAPLYSESKYMRRKRRQEWQTDAKGFENHKYRAAFLAAEKLWQIANLVRDRNGSPDWHFSLALMKAVGAKHMLNTMSGQ